MTRGGLPHSEIPGSKLICSSPGLIAACHVLHRLLAPRHSPYTLSSLTIRNSELTITGVFAYTPIDASSYANTACLWSEKTTVCRIFSCQRSTWGLRPQTPCSLTRRGPKARLRSLAKAQSPFAALKPRTSITSSLGRCATTAARSRPKPANNQAMDVDEGRPDGLTHSPRTFQRAPNFLSSVRLRASRFGRTTFAELARQPKLV